MDVPAGSGPAPTGSGPAPTRPRRGYLVPGIIALAVATGLALAINATMLAHHDPSNLNGPDVALYLSQAIQAAEAADSPPQVRCPASEPLRQGWSFACQLRGLTGTARVEVSETDATGQFTWRIAGAR
ncbi:MAG TPA: hypothetical protein VMW49_08425 [Candidatus Dormibacteraeota bacterium]|nr:hypothetical protein [Candidatus Dormibacteraeota bacterium]